MKRLWVAAALAPLSFAATARAQVTISNQTSTPIFTATANNGQPSDVVIAAGASVTPKTGGAAGSPLAAVTLNSSNNVTNKGTISFRDLNDVVGVQGQGGNTGSIDNEGSITLDESATQHINTTNGIADGIFQNNAFVSNFALGADRIGIQVTGTAPLIGNITNGVGSITVVGEKSAGISIGAGGITGNLTDSGAITVTGDNSFGIHSAGLIGGNVSVSGALSATGNGAVGLALDQGASGNVAISSTVNVTGFHSLTPPVTPTQVNALTPNQLMSGGPAVTIGGSVGGGVSIDAPVAAVAATGNTPAVAASAGGAITASGSPGLVIGATAANPGAITIGAGAGGASLLVGGTVSSTGIYQNFNATGIQIGTGNGAVNLPGGIDISGTVTASSVATNLSATDGANNPINGTAIGLRLESGAAVSGAGITIGAPNVVGGGLSATSTSTVANTVTALQIDSGAVRPAGGATLTNFGTINASITGIAAVIGSAPAAGGTLGNATAVNDQGGVLGTINNTGSISASVTPVVPLQAVDPSARIVALNLTGNTAGVTVNQTQAAIIPATASTSATTPAAPSITGDVLFGSGAANLNLLAGTLTGAVSFGTGANSLDIENGATLTGALSEAKGGSLALSVGVAPATVASTLNNTGTSSVGLSSLNIGSHGQVLFTIDPNGGGGSSFNVSGDVNLAAGAKIGLNLVSAISTVQNFTLVSTTGVLTSAQPAQSLIGQTPFLFNASVSETTGQNGSITASVSPKTAAQLGLNAAEASAYTAVLDRLAASGAGADPAVTADVLSKNFRGDFIHLYDQFLPDYEGGPFDSLVVAQGQIAQAEADPPLKLQTDQTRGWVQEIGYLNDRQQTADANGYHASGFGLIGGLEQARGDSAIGVTAAFLTSGVGNVREGPGGILSTAGLEAGIYWRAGAADGGLNLHASLNGGYLFLSNHRLLFDEDSAGTVNLFREAKSQWNGLTASGELGASYYVPIGRFYVRPEVIADYVYLYEGAFTERGGGPAEDLAVASRSSGEASVQGDLVLGADLGGAYHLRPEMTLGWREVISGGPGDTTARFAAGGPSFSLSPKFNDKGSLIGRLGLRAGGQFADFSANAGGQYNSTYQVYDARAVARFLF